MGDLPVGGYSWGGLVPFFSRVNGKTIENIRGVGRSLTVRGEIGSKRGGG